MFGVGEMRYKITMTCYNCYRSVVVRQSVYPYTPERLKAVLYTYRNSKCSRCIKPVRYRDSTINLDILAVL